MEKKVYIRGNSCYPSKVCAELEKRGGQNINKFTFVYEGNLYYIDDGGVIKSVDDGTLAAKLLTTHPDYVEIFVEPAYKFRIDDIVIYEGGKYYVEDVYNRNGQPFYRITNGNCIIDPVSEHLLKANEKIEILTWSDMVNEKVKIEGFYFSNGKPAKSKVNHTANEVSLYRTEKQAKSAIAMANISQLIEQPAYGGYVPLGREAITITVHYMYAGDAKVGFTATSRHDGGLLRFNSLEQAKLFFDKNEQLVKDYLMVD